MNILGVVAHTLGYGDAGAALAVDGEVAGFVEEERFTRLRYDDGFPRHAIQWLLKRGGIEGRDVDLVVLHIHPMHGIANRLYWLLRHPVETARNIGDYWRCYREYGNLKRELGEAMGTGAFRVEYYDHHKCHAAAAFYTSPFERAACLTIDGAGEGATGSIWLADREQGLRQFRRFRYPHSLGIFYSAVGDHIGFPPPAGPGKVMGLAAHGDPKRYLPLMRDAVCADRGSLRLNLDYFAFHRNLATPKSPKPWTSQRFVEAVGFPRRRREEELEQRHIDLAAALQARTDEIGLELSRTAVELTGERRLCIGGGVGLNSVMNGVIYDSGIAEDLHVQPAPGDAGNALGAIYLAATRHRGQIPRFDAIPYGGPEFSNEEIRAALGRFGLACEATENVVPLAAEAIKRGRIVGWFQGRMEHGPRALGCRSILADPQVKDMKDIINRKVKHREWFRPFAPSVTVEACHRYFTGPQHNPYMLIVADLHEKWRDLLPSIAHVDGTARVQSVAREENPKYHALLTRLGEIHNHPVVLNTSFNDQEPIVCTPEDAIRCFLGTEIDELYIGDFAVVSKRVERVLPHSSGRSANKACLK